jgi:hypothetical protein
LKKRPNLSDDVGLLILAFLRCHFREQPVNSGLYYLSRVFFQGYSYTS